MPEPERPKTNWSRVAAGVLARSRLTGKDYRTDVVGYARDIIGMEPTREQRRIMLALTPKDPDNFQIRVCVRTGHNIGKTALSAVYIRWAFDAFHDGRIITTAPTFRQVRYQTWAEVHKWSASMAGCTLNQTSLTDDARPQHYALGASADKPDHFRGFHEKNIFYLFEEGSGIEDNIFEAAEGSYQHNYIALIISNPGAPLGYFYDVCMGRKTGWENIHINSEHAELVDKRWVKQMREDYGEDSPTYAMKVRGDFPDMGADQVYALHGIERAIGERGDVPAPSTTDAHARLLVCDVADSGGDRTVITASAWKFGPGDVPEYGVVEAVRYYQGNDTSFTVGELERMGRKYKPNIICIDSSGVGVGVYNQLLHITADKKYPWLVMDYKGSYGAMDSRQYHNAKAEAHFSAAKWFKDGTIHFSQLVDDRARQFYKADLLVYKYDYDSTSRLIVIDPRSATKSGKYNKDEKLKIKSPDFGDTVGMTAWALRFSRQYTSGATLPTLDDLRGEERPDSNEGDTTTVGDLFG